MLGIYLWDDTSADMKHGTFHFITISANMSEILYDHFVGKDLQDNLLTLATLTMVVFISAVGRQCMASCFFLLRQFEDVLIYLKSIKQYLATDDDFNWNYGIACASNGEWAEAEEAFGAVQGIGYRQEGALLNWSARTFIKQGKHARLGGGKQEVYYACAPVLSFL